MTLCLLAAILGGYSIRNNTEWLRHLAVRGDSGKRVPITGAAATYITPLDQLLRRHGIGRPTNLSIEIRKSARLMTLYVDGTRVKTYVIGLGGSPDAKKTRRGDSATPEGLYYVCQKLPQSQYYLSLKLSYPNVDDARQGIARGLIDKTTFDKIQRAISGRKMPPMNTRLGGNICIHGGGAGRLNWKGKPPYVDVNDWTAGCVAVRNSDMDELFSLIPLGTPVRIRP